MVPVVNPDFSRLMELVNGIPIVTAKSFTPNGAPPPLRAKYLCMATAVSKLMQQLYDAGKVIIVSTEMALKLKLVHFSAS